MATGVEDSQWVKVAGIIRSTAMQTLKKKLKYPELTVATADGGRLNVLVNDDQGPPLQSLVDAEVKVTGIAESIYNGKRQLISVRLLTPGAKFLEVKRAAPQDAAVAPPRPIGSLRQFSPDEPSAHRVKVQGIVTLQQRGECLFIRDGTGSIRLETSERDPVSPGDRVEVLGFPAIYDYTLVLEDSVFRKVGTAPPVPPVELTVKEALQGNHDADLICMNARLLDQFRTPDQLVLVLEEGDTLFRAQLAEPKAGAVTIRDGAWLRVTGICLAQLNYLSPRTFQMVLRSPADLLVLRRPSWWTAQRMHWALYVLTGVLCGVGIWVWTLQKQVSRQTRSIRDKIEREAVLQERMRIAREFHDNLEQELAGVRMQLETSVATVATAPETAVASLKMARTMICHSQAEVHRSVWELRSQMLENNSLSSALSAAVRSLESGVPMEISISGPPRTLPLRVESNLLRIAQEATTNALKHAQPLQVFVQLDYEPQGVRLKICDDGRGFYVDGAPGGNVGHFGLLGMRERVDKMGGTLQY
jgi:signal transduction histidine kinase